MLASRHCAQTPPIRRTTVPRVIRRERRASSRKVLSASRSSPLRSTPERLGGEPCGGETESRCRADASSIGSVSATLPDGLPLDVFTSQDKRWLEVHVERSGEPTSPRVLVASVPFALRASDAETLGGKPASAFLLAEPVFSAQPSQARSKTSTKSDPPLTTFNANQGLYPRRPRQRWQPRKLRDVSRVPSREFDRPGHDECRGITSTFRSTTSSARFTGFAVQNRNGSPNASSGMLFYDQNGALAMFQGFNNAGHEYRINNIAPGGAINFITGSTSRFLVANSGNIGIGVASPASEIRRRRRRQRQCWPSRARQHGSSRSDWIRELWCRRRGGESQHNGSRQHGSRRRSAGQCYVREL